MAKVTKEELALMDAQADRCIRELADARIDIVSYACLVAIMSTGNGYHREAERRLGSICRDVGLAAPVVTSAGALLYGIETLKAKKVALITPYMKPLTALVIDYLEAEGVEVVDSISLEIEDNLAVGARDPLALVDIADRLDISGADLLIASACVQMPSLAAIDTIQRRRGIPTISAAVCTAHSILQNLGLKVEIDGFGALFSEQ